MAVVVNIVPIPEPIKIKVGDAAIKPTPSIRLELNIRKSLSGDLMIFDHADIDIVLSGKNNKITAFPKETMNDLVYGAQNRLFAFLRKKGIVLAESVQGGSFYGAIEGVLEAPYDDKINAAKMALINISKFIDEERPYFESVEAQIAGFDDEVTEPDKTDSTELGEVPQKDRQGSIRPGFVRDPYSFSYMYTV
jgi:hypothetical protein|tara:strand:- start:1020 stop:1598 length:579 start_codon:yes stop_codon:yes gene_type:complete